MSLQPERSLLISDLVEFSENRGEADAKSLQTLIKLLHRRFRGSTAEKTLVRLFHFLMLSIRPNVLVSKLLLLTFYLEIYFRPLFSLENLKLKHYSDDDALVLL